MSFAPMQQNDRMAMLADLLGDPNQENLQVARGMVQADPMQAQQSRTAVPPPIIPQNYVQRGNNAPIDLGPSQGIQLAQNSIPLDYSQAPVEFGGQKGYRVKGDPFTVVMQDGTKLSLGNDTAAARARMAEDLKLAQAKAQIAHTQAQTDQIGKANIPAGYRATDKGLEPIPGGPADFKQQGKFNQDIASMTATESALNTLAEQANAIKGHAGLDAATGWQTLFPTMPGSKAADATAQLDTLKSKTAFGTLQAMRDASKTGGALGAVSEKELKLLESNIAALSTAQSPEQFRKSLDEIVKYAEQAKTRTRDAFNMSHGGEKKSGAAAGGKHVTVTNDAEYNALPSGAIYTTPDGATRTKR